MRDSTKVLALSDLEVDREAMLAAKAEEEGRLKMSQDAILRIEGALTYNARCRESLAQPADLGGDQERTTED